MTEIDEAIERLTLQRQDLEHQALILQQEPHRTCVMARNGFSKPRIAHDFAERIRLHDNGEPVIGRGPRRNYDRLSGNVIVFCVVQSVSAAQYGQKIVLRYTNKGLCGCLRHGNSATETTQLGVYSKPPQIDV